MTTNYAHYLVAYPHPSVPKRSRIKLFKLDYETSGEMLRELLKSIYKEHSSDLDSATLWTVSELAAIDAKNSNQKIYERIKKREEHPEHEIELFHFVANHFPSGPQLPSGNWVDIVVVTQEILEDMDYQGDTDGNLLRMKTRLELSRTIGIGSPSDCVKSFAAIKETVLDRGGPRYGRPSDRFGPPTALFNDALAGLQYDLEHLEALTPQKANISHAFELVSRSAGFFHIEDRREENLRETLKNLLPGESKWKEKMAGGAIIPDGVWFEGSAVYMIFELKNEPGLGGDPSLQCLAVYSRIIQQKEYSRFSSRSNTPVVLLSLAGNRFEVSTAVFTDAVYADKLLSLELRLGPHGPDNVLRIARIFMAINRCTDQLCTQYSNLGTLPNVVPSVMYPSPTADPPASTAEMIPQLEFFSKLDRVNGTPLAEVDEDNKRHGIYLARMPNDASAGDTSAKVVLVKFTAKYNEAAHRLLANHDPPLAPALYHCVRVIGGLHMVVMEYMSSAKPLHYFLLSSPPSPPPNADVVHRDVRKALDLLHEQNWVFGDLRQINVLYSSEDERAFLVDFDWVGKHKVDRYSPCLNNTLGLGVDKWDLMRKSDDDANLENVMEWLSKKSSQHSRSTR